MYSLDSFRCPHIIRKNLWWRMRYDNKLKTPQDSLKETTPHDRTMQQTNMYVVTGHKQTKYLSLESTPHCEWNLMVGELQYLCKVSIEEHNKIFPWNIHTKIEVHTNQIRYWQTVFSHNQCTDQVQKNIISKVLPRGMIHSSIINVAEGSSTRKLFIMARVNRQPLA